MGTTMADCQLRRRANLVFVVMTALFAVLLGRLYTIQVLAHDDYTSEALNNQIQRERQPAVRGPIRSSDGQDLAMTRPAVTICADLRYVKDRRATADALAELTGESAERFYRLMNKPNRKWVELLRRADVRLGPLVQRADLDGIRIQDAKTRYYPLGRAACHIAGLTDTEGEGKEALEMVFDRFLNGRDAWQVRRIDGGRRVVAASDVDEADIEGAAVVLTVNTTIQTFLNEALDGIVAEFEPRGISAVVLDVEASRVLALANRPDVDPNDRSGLKQAHLRNRTVTDAYEPGSVFKAFVWASVLDAGLARTDEEIHCEHGAWIYRGRRLHDAHGYGRLTVHDGLVKSSNIMAAKLGLRLGIPRLHASLQDWGIGSKTGIELPGESPGLLRPVKNWNEIYSITSIPMGQEVQTTALQLATAYAALARGGWYLPPRLIEQVESPGGEVVWQPELPDGHRVVSPTAARRVIDMLADVVKRGTGRRAQSDYYALAGKTGTAQKALPGQGYVDGKWISSFCGFGPAENPRVVCVIMVDEPKNAHYGGVVAGPAVSHVLENSLLYMGVPTRANSD